MANPAASQNDSMILSALLVAKKHLVLRGHIELTGSTAFKQRAIALIAEYDLPLVLKNDAQRQMLVAAREAVRSEPPLPAPSAQAGEVLFEARDASAQLKLLLVKAQGDFVQGVVRHDGAYKPVLGRLCRNADGQSYMLLNDITSNGLTPLGRGNPVNNADGSFNHYVFRLKDEPQRLYAAGMDDLAVQMRSLGMMLVISAQDIQRFIDQFRGEYQTVNANMLIKWFMALQDEKDTFELAKATAGKDYYAELGEVKRTPGTVSSHYEDANTTYIREKHRISLDELKDLNPGEGFISFKSALVPSNAIYIPDSEKQSSTLALKINRFIDVDTPGEAELLAQQPQLARLLPPAEMDINTVLHRTDDIIAGSAVHTLPPLMDPVLATLVQVALDLDNRSDISYSPSQRGILLFEAARAVLNKRGTTWFTVKTQPDPLKVSDAMARKLVEQSGAFMPKDK
ncbi:MAG: hypothetical protein ACMX3H_03130 [Sodalis sp. (in: enterobacteria)]|uniref:hypothetical protein n=1 Tax=Sodalis sp. (in: enterobacteria) TaxID=1898979 RepID=UPI0039E71DE5